MLTLVPQPIEDYAQEHSSAVPDLFSELVAYTVAHTDLPQMQVGALEGNLLMTLALATGARRILEIGTFTGYSTLMMARALPADGHLDTCDIDPHHAAIAQKFFDKSPDGSKIKLHLGSALASLKGLDGPYDLAFIDADKENYINYFKAIEPKMRAGGVIAIDNVLWSGRVLDPDGSDDTCTPHLAAFNAYLKGRTDLQKVMLTVRDGITLVYIGVAKG